MRVHGDRRAEAGTVSQSLHVHRARDRSLRCKSKKPGVLHSVCGCPSTKMLDPREYGASCSINAEFAEMASSGRAHPAVQATCILQFFGLQYTNWFLIICKA